MSEHVNDDLYRALELIATGRTHPKRKDGDHRHYHACANRECNNEYRCWRSGQDDCGAESAHCEECAAETGWDDGSEMERIITA